MSPVGHRRRHEDPALHLQRDRRAELAAAGRQHAPAPGKCLDVSGDGTADSTAVQLWTCNGSGAQNWRPSPTGPAQSAVGQVLDVLGGSSADGAGLQIYACNRTPAQRWLPTRGILPLNPLGEVIGLADKCLDDRSGQSGNGTVVQLFACNRTFAQRWTAVGDHNLTVLGQCLDVGRAAARPTARRVQIWTCNGTGAQTWYVRGERRAAEPPVRALSRRPGRQPHRRDRATALRLQRHGGPEVEPPELSRPPARAPARGARLHTGGGPSG